MTEHGETLRAASPCSNEKIQSDPVWVAQLRDIEVVSFDVFDTLLLRRHFVPTDVFMEPAIRGSERPHFRLLRIAAERLARLQHRHREDITLDDIYRWLPQDARIELDAEARTLYANPVAMGLYREAIEQGKRVIAISDMYLPRAFIARLLHGCGYEAISDNDVFVSSEIGLTKGSGTMYGHVVRVLDMPPDRILHVGDNPVSDVTRARTAGYRVHHLRPPGHAFTNAEPEFIHHMRRKRSVPRSLLLGLMRDAHARRGADDYWYDFGFRIAGPTISTFARWVADRTRSLGADHAYFLARDGSLPLQMLREQGDGLPATYMHASRRLFLVPAMEALDETTLESLCTSLPGTPAQEFWDRLGIDNPDAQALLHRHFPARDRIVTTADRRRLAEFFRAVHPLILPDIRREREMLRSYLDAIGFLDASNTPLIVDVGWRASSQKLLEQALPELKGTPGAYFGLSTGAYQNGAMDAYFFSGDQPGRHVHLAMHCIEIVEALFSAPHPSVQRIETDEAGKHQPVYATNTEDARKHANIVSRIHEGALDFERDLRSLQADGHALNIGRDDIADLLSAVILHPGSRDIAHLGRLPHALGLGSSRFETLLPNPLPASPIGILQAYLGPERQRLYWPRGLVHAVTHYHGAAHGFGARCAVTLHALALRARGLWMRG
jgi:FMN phosphatase YigB (HAD superfamily)